jgi:phosphoglycolate phosphatase-like HAD superfamily hydrolase
MFREMRAALNIPKSIDILEHIQTLSSEPDTPSSGNATATNPSPPTALLSSTASRPDPTPNSPQARAVAAVKSIERNAMSSQRPQPGLVELMTYLDKRGVRKALCTRNFPAPVHHLLSTYLPGVEFGPVVTRETEGVAPKPSPEGLWFVAREWGLGERTGEEVDGGNGQEGDMLELARRVLGGGVIMVGDSIDDMKAGRRAGAATVLLVNEENEHLVEDECTDCAVKRLDEIIGLLDRGFEARLR